MGNAARFHNFVFPNDALDYRLAWQALVDRGRPWPSLWTDLFNYPDGFPISLMDGLPLAATVFLEAPARIGVASHLHPVGLVEQRHLHAPDSTSESTAGPRSALIQPSPAGLTSSRMRASVNILRSPTSATMENPKRRLGGAV